MDVSLVSFKPGKTQRRRKTGLSMFRCMRALLVFMWLLEKAMLPVVACAISHMHVILVSLGYACHSLLDGPGNKNSSKQAERINLQGLSPNAACP